MTNSRPIGVRRALACDIEPPLLSAVVRNHHTGIGGSPHRGANNLYGHYTDDQDQCASLVPGIALAGMGSAG